jgi:hypothetical protein
LPTVIEILVPGDRREGRHLLVQRHVRHRARSTRASLARERRRGAKHPRPGVPPRGRPVPFHQSRERRRDFSRFVRDGRDPPVVLSHRHQHARRKTERARRAATELHDKPRIFAKLLHASSMYDIRAPRGVGRNRRAETVGGGVAATTSGRRLLEKIVCSGDEKRPTSFASRWNETAARARRTFSATASSSPGR